MKFGAIVTKRFSYQTQSDSN